MTHLLPGGGLSRVHGAGRPVPPGLPSFATPRSVRHLATVVAGAYPLRRPPDAWSPGLPARLGPCYWLVASGTPMGWRRGCLAAGLVRSTVCYYWRVCCRGRVCARLAAGPGGWGRCRFLLLHFGLHSSLESPVMRVADCPVRVSLPVACRYAIPCGLCVPRARSGCPSGLCRVSVACVCAHAPAAYAPLPPPPGRCGSCTTRGSGGGRW